MILWPAMRQWWQLLHLKAIAVKEQSAGTKGSGTLLKELHSILTKVMDCQEARCWVFSEIPSAKRFVCFQESSVISVDNTVTFILYYFLYSTVHRTSLGCSGQGRACSLYKRFSLFQKFPSKSIFVPTYRSLFLFYPIVNHPSYCLKQTNKKKRWIIFLDGINTFNFQA